MSFYSLAFSQIQSNKVSNHSSEFAFEPTADKSTFHKKTKVNSVSKFGHYFSFGTGVGSGSRLTLLSVEGGYSLAYKSHLLTLVANSCFTILNGGSYHDNYYHNGSFSKLFGEALRTRHFLLAASSGISFSATTYHWGRRGYMTEEEENNIYKENGTVIPIEGKVYYLFNHMIGIGFTVWHLVTKDHRPTTYCFSIVFGNWKAKKPAAIK